ncbi:MAG TPA: arylamine N-acetyltransferase, partial [Holophagaceae bacterium]|nr:arylamine N-acetyltransferase [Holophagaceae bacterium]
MSGVLDLEAYLARIGYAGGLSPDLPTLTALHEAHALAVPFENLAIQMGEGVRIDLASLQDKLVRRRRGGYCFEQNGLFLAVLRALGFAVDPFEARVRFGTDAVLPRTHMLLRVRLPEGDFLADVGFGGQGVRRPVPLDGTVSDQA